MRAVDRKTYWDLLETLDWICTRTEGVAPVPHMDGAMFSRKAALDLRSLLLVAEHDFETNRETAASLTPVSVAGASRECSAAGRFAATAGSDRHRSCASLRPADRRSPDIEEAWMIAPSQTLNFLLRQVQIRRIQMTAIKCGKYRVRQLVLPAELNDMEFRMTPGHRIANVGLWSRSRNNLIWRSPQFLRADIIRVWPARIKKIAAVSDAILRHLQAIMTSAAPLSKAEAQRRCLAEVPNAYHQAFNKAWALLDPSRKRGRGQRDANRVLSEEISD